MLFDATLYAFAQIPHQNKCIALHLYGKSRFREHFTFGTLKPLTRRFLKNGRPYFCCFAEAHRFGARMPSTDRILQSCLYLCFILRNLTSWCLHRRLQRIEFAKDEISIFNIEMLGVSESESQAASGVTQIFKNGGGKK